MPHIPDPNHPDASDSARSVTPGFSASLAAGLDAIEKKNYSEAIAHLETVYQNAERRSVRLRAQMGLVKAYEGKGEYQQAFIRCKALLNSSSEATRVWAEEAISVLKQRYAQIPKPSELTQASPSNDDHAQKQPGRSPFLTEASTLVDPLAINQSDLPSQLSTEAKTLIDPPDMEPPRHVNEFPTEASTLVDPLAIEPSALPSNLSMDEPTTPSRESAQSPSQQSFDAGTSSDGAGLDDAANLTGFVPLEEVPDASQSANTTVSNPVHQDITGFVPLQSDQSSSTDIQPSASPPSPNDLELTESSTESSDDLIEESLDENPFAFNLDDLSGASNEVNTTDYVSFEQDNIRDQRRLTDSDNPSNGSNGIDSPHSTTDPYPRTVIQPDFPESTTSSQSASPPSNIANAQAVDPELAAALNISMPRLGKPRSPRKASSDSAVTPTPERARTWKPLKPIKQLEFWLSYAWTAIALVIFCTALTQIALATAEPVWRLLRNVVPMPRWYFLQNRPTVTVILLLLIGLVVAQWVLSFILGQCYKAKSLPNRELERRSPETVRMLKRECQKYKIPVPTLRLLPSQVPFILSYGLLPRTSCIVVSQGLLTQLDDAELAALYAAELGHIRHYTTLPLMLVIVVSQIPFLIYRYSAAWGDRRRNLFLRGIAAGLSSTAYGLFWLFRWPGLWLARTRQIQGDRYAVNLTGNPNGRALSLTTMTKGMAQAIERQRSIESILVSMEMLMPVSPQQALTLGSVSMHQSQSAAAPDTATAADASSATPLSPALLTWDVLNPYRHWLLFNNSHPLMGERIQALNQDAQHLRLRPSISIPSRPSSDISPAGKKQPFLLQISPYIGAPVGIGLALILWLVGRIAGIVDFEPLAWLWKDRSLLYGFLAMGFSFGTLMRVNGFFPDLSPSKTESEAALVPMLQDPNIIPLNSVPVTFEGRLLGRSGMGNGMGQDLMLRTKKGTLKLHWISPIGPLGNLIIGRTRPTKLIGRSVSVTGWFRRGATVWIDVEKIRVDGRTLVHSSHPLWSTLVAIAATLWGAYVIYRGTL